MEAVADSVAEETAVFSINARNDDWHELIAIVARAQGAISGRKTPWDARVECREDHLKAILDAAAGVIYSFAVQRFITLASVLDEYGYAEAASRFRHEADLVADIDPSEDFKVEKR